MMKFCPECGNKLSEGAKFCDSCGTKVSGSVMANKSESAESKGITIPQITDENLHMMLDDNQVDAVVSKFEALKEDTDCERIHIAGEKDFDEFVETFTAILKKRGVDGDVVEASRPMAIALIDNGKSGLGKRGTLITRFGLVVLDQDVPNFEDDAEIEGVIPWRLFAYFSAPFDSENYRLLDFKKLLSANEVDDDIKSEIKKGEADLMLRFGRTDLEESQIKELIDCLKTIVTEAGEVEDEDDDRDEEDDEDAEKIAWDKGLANEEAQLESEIDDDEMDETGEGDDDIDD